MCRLFTAVAIALVAPTFLNAATDRTFPTRSAPVHGTPPAHPTNISVLYDQNNNLGGTSSLSQNFGDFPTFSSQLADDFVVPGGISWAISEVAVSGVYFNGPGPATDTDVVFYADAAGLPGAAVCTFNNVVPTSGLATGSFVIDLPNPCRLGAGTYWVSVQANMNFTPNGEWGWTDRSVTSNNPAAWQNPGGGFAGPCTAWGQRGPTCNIDNGNNDQGFTLSGDTFVCDRIINGGFETGDLFGWIIDGTNNAPVISTAQAHSGTYSVQLGNINPDPEPLGDSALHAEISVPLSGGTLSFWTWTSTIDSITFDWQDAYITDVNGNILQTIFHECNNAQTWQNVTVDMTPYAGQIVHVRFLVHQDGFGDDTAMFIDDVSLLVNCPDGVGLGVGQTVGFPPSGYTQEANDLVRYTYMRSEPAPNDYAIFQTHDPWGGTVVKDAITGNGHTWTVFPVTALPGFNFSAYKVVVLNFDDEIPGNFAPSYNAALPALQSYFLSGGVLWVETAMQSDGSTYIMPDGATCANDFQNNNFIVDTDSPIMQGVPNPFTGTSASHVSFTNLDPTAHVVVVTGTDNTGTPTLYEFRSTQCVTLPTATVSGDATICAGASTPIQAALTGTPPWTVSWSDGQVDTGVGASPDVRNVSPASTTVYTVTSVVDATGCPGTSSGSATVTVNPLPTPVITGADTFCTGGNTTLDAGAGYAAYLWSDGETTETIVVSAPGTFTVTVTDGNGCQGTSAPVTVVENNQPTGVAASANSPVCAGSTINLSSGAPAAGYSLTYTWLATSCGASSPLSLYLDGSVIATVDPDPAQSCSCFPSLGTYIVPPASLPPLALGPHTLGMSMAPGNTFFSWGFASLDVNGVVQQIDIQNFSGGGYGDPNLCDGNAGSFSQALVPFTYQTYSLSYSWLATSCGTSIPLTLLLDGNPITTVDPDPASTCTCGVVSVQTYNVPAAQLPNISPGAHTFGMFMPPSGNFTPFSWGSATIDFGTGPQTFCIQAFNAPPCGDNNICDGYSVGNFSASVPGTANAPALTYSWTGPNGFTSTLANPSIPNATTAASGTYTVTVTNSGTGCASQASVNVTVNPTASLPPNAPNAQQNVPYSTTFTASGGTAPYTWSSGGSLPTGLSLNASTGVLSGTPTTLGNFFFTITVTDANGCSVSQNYVITVSCAAINLSPATLPSGTPGAAYSQTVTASGGTAPYTFTSSGSLPAGLSMDGAGNITGTPTTAGSSTFNVTATDVNGCSGSAIYTIAITPLSIASVDNSCGPAAGGTTVTITGTNFLNGATVKFLDVASPSVTFVNSSTIQATTPPSAPGAVGNITVTNPNGDTATLTDGWGYDFNDVPGSNPFHNFVCKLVRHHITAGCGSGDYCPATSILRNQMAVFIMRAVHGASYTPPQATGTMFSDVPANAFGAAFIEEAAREGIMGVGEDTTCGAGAFCPTDAVTRLSMAYILLRGEHGGSYNPPAANCGTFPFVDITCPSTDANWVAELVAEGITAGCDATHYCPTNAVTRAQMAVFMSVTFSLP